jgi:hypothetical protein
VNRKARLESARRLAVASAAVVALAGCGGTPHAPSRPSGHAEAQWIDNAERFTGSLRDNLSQSVSWGSDGASARAALHDESDLYALLVAYTLFGGCEETLRNVGTPSPRLLEVDRTLESACRRLERAAALFTLAVKSSDARSLVAATRTALLASPFLSRAQAELDAVRGSRG